MFDLKESQEKAFEAFAEGADRYVGEVEKTDGASVDTDILTSAVYNYHTDMCIISKSYGIDMYNDGFKNGQKEGTKCALAVGAVIVAVGFVAAKIGKDISERLKMKAKIKKEEADHELWEKEKEEGGRRCSVNSMMQIDLQYYLRKLIKSNGIKLRKKEGN